MITNKPQIIVPPACIGIMGGGQLARMFAIAAKQMGYKVAILEPDPICPAQYFADHHIKTAYDDAKGLAELANLCSVITTEFENIPAKSIDFLAKHSVVYPNSEAIQICQNRLKEKDFFNKSGIKTAQFIAIRCNADIDQVDATMYPAILKTNTLGYDGKGQINVNNKSELINAFIALNSVECILEKKVAITKEVSAILARSPNNEYAIYPIVENIHKNGILDFSIAPANIAENIKILIKNHSHNIINNLNYVGVLAIEYFITDNDEIIANEMAPRPHNSGHHTLDIYNGSQFEQQVRAICNLALIDNSDSDESSIMLNLLGDLWINIDMQHKLAEILSKYNNVKLHLYEKTEARIGRKMGHLTILGANAKNTLLEIKKLLLN